MAVVNLETIKVNLPLEKCPCDECDCLDPCNCLNIKELFVLTILRLDVTYASGTWEVSAPVSGVFIGNPVGGTTQVVYAGVLQGISHQLVFEIICLGDGLWAITYSHELLDGTVIETGVTSMAPVSSIGSCGSGECDPVWRVISAQTSDPPPALAGKIPWLFTTRADLNYNPTPGPADVCGCEPWTNMCCPPLMKATFGGVYEAYGLIKHVRFKPCTYGGFIKTGTGGGFVHDHGVTPGTAPLPGWFTADASPSPGKDPAVCRFEFGLECDGTIDRINVFYFQQKAVPPGGFNNGDTTYRRISGLDLDIQDFWNDCSDLPKTYTMTLETAIGRFTSSTLYGEIDIDIDFEFVS